MRVRVLGSAAGGAFPQWNCGCANCAAARAGVPGFSPRTEDSLAVTGDGAKFVLVNAAPSVGEQLRRTPDLHPRGTRHSPIGAVVLTNGDLDHVLGLFSLRESQPLAIYATRAVREGLLRSVFVRTLSRFPGHTVWRDLELGVVTELASAAGEPLGLALTAHAAPGKQALHLEGLVPPGPEDNVAVTLEANGARVVYAGAAGAIGDYTRAFAGCDALFFDGTFFDEHELATSGCGDKPARSMAHVPVRTTLTALAGLRARRKILTHVNNTNPLLDPASAERAEAEAAGWEIAWDGMEIVA